MGSVWPEVAGPVFWPELSGKKNNHIPRNPWLGRHNRLWGRGEEARGRAGLGRWRPCLRLTEVKWSGQGDPTWLGFGQSWGRCPQIVNGWGTQPRHSSGGEETTAAGWRAARGPAVFTPIPQALVGGGSRVHRGGY